MEKMGLVPSNPDVQNLSKIHWILLYRIIFHQERKKIERYSLIAKKMFSGMLGIDFGNDKIIPLSAFINGEMFKKVLEKIEIDKEFDESLSDELNEDEGVVDDVEVDQYMEDVFSTDIDSLLSDEDLAKIDELKEEEIKRLESLVGVKYEEEEEK